MHPLSPEDEAERLRRLELYRVMDSAAERSYDNLTRLAAQLCEMPISLVSLVDDRRQWFKSAHGLAAKETPREHAFCAHAIQSDEVFVIEDATKDQRFAGNPLVVGEPSIGFYAGAPLVMDDGHRLGTLCVIDDKPRTLTPLQLEALETLRDAVVGLLELGRAKADMEALQRLLPICAWCRDVRVSEDGGSGEWQPLHDYVCERVEVTHGICPRCHAVESARE